MSELKNKFLDLINKQKFIQRRNSVKIPAMGFSDYFIQNLSDVPDSVPSKSQHDEKCEENESQKLSDLEILESTDQIYFQENVDTEDYELKKLQEINFNPEVIAETINTLKQQHKVVSKKVLQNILDKRTVCNEEFSYVGDTEKLLEEALWTCKKARSCLNFARKNITTTSLEILATYRRRMILSELLVILNTVKKLKSTDIEVQKLLTSGNYSGAITILLDCKNSATKNSQLKCVELLTQKLQDTLINTEVQLDNVLNQMTQEFDANKYGKLQEAYHLLGKSALSMDQLHMNFISNIHTVAFNILHNHLEQTGDDKQQKMLFEQLCENIPPDKCIPCLIALCKSFWTILVCYHQVCSWHKNFNVDSSTTAEIDSIDRTDYIQEKLFKGKSRLWNDIQSKIYTFLSTQKLYSLKYEQFIQVLSIVQRLKRVGNEFCNESSSKLMEVVKAQSVEFFNRYHDICLEELCLFMDNEAWVPLNSICSIMQLQEFHTIRNSLKKYNRLTKDDSVYLHKRSVTNECIMDETASSELNSQDGSSNYGQCGYFHRYLEMSSPFDGGFDESMLQEDILAGIIDETSCYYSEDSDDDEQKQGLDAFETSEDSNDGTSKTRDTLIANNTSLTVLRCIGRYLHMCRLLHSISPQIIKAMTELIDFYIYATFYVFGKDLPVPSDNLYSDTLNSNLNRISNDILPRVRNWPASFQMINVELCDPETLYGLDKRIVGVESGVTLVEQFKQLQGYLNHLLSTRQSQEINNYLDVTSNYICNLRKPIYMCTTARMIDIHNILTDIGKVKWDINHVMGDHSPYVNKITRNLQTFRMQLEDIEGKLMLSRSPKFPIWDSLVHVLTHTLVEGYSCTKKCSTSGRALMQLDFTYLMSMLELIAEQKFPEHNAYVDTFIKSYYLPVESFESWITEQLNKNMYSTKQISNLINTVCVADRKSRVKLLSLLENKGSS